jgi:hypothetical protein
MTFSELQYNGHSVTVCVFDVCPAAVSGLHGRGPEAVIASLHLRYYN